MKIYLPILFLYFLAVSTSKIFPWKIIETSNADPIEKYGMHGQVYGPQSKIWLFGGVPENRSLVSSPDFWTGFAGANNVLRTFDPVSKVFAIINSTGPIPPARGFFDMVKGIPSTGSENILFLFGGQGLNPTENDSKDLGDLWSFNTSSLTWQNLTGIVTGTLPSKRTGPAMITANGKIYIYGGVQNYGLFLSDFYSFDPLTNVITQINPVGPVPGSRSITNIAKHNNFIYITNGCCDTNSETGGYYQDMWRYDIMNNVWSQIQPKGKVYSTTYAGSVENGDWWLFQGGDQGGCLTDLPLLETSLFNFVTNTWYRNIVPRYASGPLIKNAKLSLVYPHKEVYQMGGYSSNRSDDAWCLQSDQEYKGLVYKYNFINLWSIIAGIINS